MIRYIIGLLLDALFKRRPQSSTPPPVYQQRDFAGRIVQAMKRHGFRVDVGPDVYNIVYIKNVDSDGNERPDRGRYHYDDQRIILQVIDGKAIVVGAWDATVDPFISVNDGGAAQIACPSQLTVWHVGMHKGVEEGLVQTGGPVLIFRDSNWNYKRDAGDKPMSGWYGINQHSGMSAGCLTVPNREQQRDFMRIIKRDSRYAANRQFVFTTTILDSKDVR